MNTHADGLYGNTCKEKTLINFESAKPAVDQPSRWVDGREVDEMLYFTFHYGLTHSYHASPFIVLSNKKYK
jgi:hypothetical protein